MGKNTNNQQKLNDECTMSAVGTKTAYLLIGGGIGAGLALLFAPKSGAALRGDISDVTRKGYDQTLDLANQLKDQSAELYQAIKEKSGNVLDVAAEKFNLVQQKAEDAITQAKNKANSEVLELDTDQPRKHATSSRKPADIL